MRLHIVGSGCPDPNPNQYGSAFVLEIGDACVLVDCGPATTYKMARMGIRPNRVDHVFLTHLHFDHNVDLPCFALTRWDQSISPDPPLRVYGPPPTASFVERLLGEGGAFYEDWQSRIHHPASHACHQGRGGSLPRPEPAVEAIDVQPGKIAKADAWAATAQRVQHVEPTLESLAYRFETAEGSVVFAGDCADCAGLRQFATGADTLVVACTYFAGSGMNRDIAGCICGTERAAGIANEAGVRRVVLTHVSPNFANPGVKERAVAEVARLYDGAIVFPNELTTVDLSA